MHNNNMTIAQFLKSFVILLGNHAYLYTFLGAMIEGETIILTISSLAYHGNFNIFYITLLAFTGTLIADQFCFYIGRISGNFILRFEYIRKKSELIFEKIYKHQNSFILTFRFIYGIRIISPFIIGMAKISIARFTILNAISAVIWAITSCGIGYTIGACSSSICQNHSYAVLANIIIIISIIGVISIIERIKSKKQ